MQIPLLLDRSRPATLAIQIVEQLRDAILQGRISPGARMPSSRKLADQLDVSRNTVVRAYEALAIESYVDSRPASGIFATDRLPSSRMRPVVVRRKVLVVGRAALEEDVPVRAGDPHVVEVADVGRVGRSA